MKLAREAARLALAIAGLGLAAPGFACGVQTAELRAGWQARKARSIKIPGQYREVSRAPSSDGIVESGVVVRPDGKIVAKVNSRQFPEAIVLCQSGRLPKHGKGGTVFAERGDDGRLYVIDFEESGTAN